MINVCNLTACPSDQIGGDSALCQVGKQIAQSVGGRFPLVQVIAQMVEGDVDSVKVVLEL